MGTGVLVSTSNSVGTDSLRFAVRSHPDGARPFVVLDLGCTNVTVHVFDPAVLTALAAVVAQAQDLLAAALAGQDPLPVDPRAA